MDKIVNHSNITEEQQKILDSVKKTGKRSGVNNTPLIEAQPTLEKSPSQRSIKGENGSFVILGRDQPSHRKSGFGSRGATNAAAIDMIAGPGSSYKHKDGTRGTPNKETMINPNFAMDAARLYVSQMADIDRYMGIAQVPGESKPGCSAIGIKADAIRLQSRQDIKIVTGRARVEAVGS